MTDSIRNHQEVGEIIEEEAITIMINTKETTNFKAIGDIEVIIEDVEEEAEVEATHTTMMLNKILTHKMHLML